MDHFIQELAVRIAETTSRRDFLSLMMRGVLGAGMGVLCVFGGERSAFADDKCRVIDERGCEGERHCKNGDSMGCNVIPRPTADIPKCITCDFTAGSRNPCVGSTPNIEKWWSCCCNNQITVCV